MQYILFRKKIIVAINILTEKTLKIANRLRVLHWYSILEEKGFLSGLEKL